ncbi:MAG: ADP-ribosylglycohydrolase family protein [Deltaproteobacteria bacterium]|nr:ADP-ribosylglycohydrolase family protein [Deltaproteobacteria bacterium]
MKTETSKTCPIFINQVVPPNEENGWVAITLAPGKKTMGAKNYWDRDLATDLDKLKELNTTTLVPFLEDDELLRLQIPDLVDFAEDRGLLVQRFPFHDGGVPKDMPETLRFIEDLCTHYAEGERIVMHCNGGIGRAGTMAACLRLALSLDDSAKTAIAQVRKSRGPRAIENRAQEAFVALFHQAWSKRRQPTGTQTEGPAQTPPADLSAEAVGEGGSRGSKKGAWFGLVVGDALGAPVEFMTASEIKHRFRRLNNMQAGGPWEKGEWTDDTALAIATAAAYRNPDGFNLAEAAHMMSAWLKTKPKDVGNQTRLALGLIEQGFEIAELPKEMMRRMPDGAGNGSLMRAAPTGLIRAPDDPRLIEESEALSSLTHPDARCVDACVGFNVILSNLLRWDGDVDLALAAGIKALEGRHPEVLGIVERAADTKRGDRRYADSPIGYVLLCLELALVALNIARSYSGGLLYVVNEGGDTDTNGAVAGALLGARFGYGGIPDDWLDALLRRDELEKAHEWIQNFVMISGSG